MPLELHEVSSDVTLLVTHRGKPIPGIEIKIFRMKNATPVLPVSPVSKAQFFTSR